MKLTLHHMAEILFKVALNHIHSLHHNWTWLIRFVTNGFYCCQLIQKSMQISCIWIPFQNVYKPISLWHTYYTICITLQAKDIVSVFRELAKEAQPTSATFSNQSAGDTLIANTKWSQRDLLRGEKTSFSKTYILSPDGPSGLRAVMATPPQEFSNV